MMKRVTKKMGRNDPCWCGSGKKYKFCHYRRDRETPVSMQDIITTTRKAYSKEYCLHAEAPLNCSKNIVKAHTIQKRGGLTKIARKGHVYGIPTDFMSVHNNEGRIKPKLIGINNASTFTGFCRFHDNTTFLPIENQEFQFDEFHTFLFSYRALCRELFAKEANIELIPYLKTLDRGKLPLEQMSMQSFFEAWQIGTEAGLRDLQNHKKRFDEAFFSQDFSSVKYYVILLENTPDFLCSGAIYPEYGFTGSKLQNLEHLASVLDALCFSIITTDTGGACLFCWIGDSVPCERFISSLDQIPTDQIPDAITRFTFEHFENVFLKPDWWDNLEENVRSKLLQRMLAGTQFDAFRSPDYLKDDGLHMVSWQVQVRQTNLHL